MDNDMKKCIVNGKVILHDEIVNKNIFIKGGMIVEISSRKPEKEDIIDAKGLYVSPGFIDIHTHGRGGHQVMEATYESLNAISKASLQTGVTSFLVSTFTMPIMSISNAIENVVKNQEKVEGAYILGVHMEGPFFSKCYKGAQPEDYMINPTIENFISIVKEYENVVKKVSLAPECEGASELIPYLCERGIVVSLGHTSATYQEAQMAIDLGATSTTHTYNAMTPLTHREVGMTGAVMLNTNVYAELILDGIHVSFPAAQILLKMKGKDKIILITDSVETAGLIDGIYESSMGTVQVKNQQVRLLNGTLAGSQADMNQCVKNAYLHLGLTLNEAVNLASSNPAKSLGIEKIGEIKEGYDADLIFFDQEFNIHQAIVKGMVISYVNNTNTCHECEWKSL